MRLVVPFLAAGALVSLAVSASAGGLSDAQADAQVIAPAEDDDAAGYSLGGLGNGGAIVAGVLLAAALAAAASSGSGSH